jgi:hypothetical protein
VKPKKYRFEIFRLTYRRYSWRFVVIEEGGTRVLARAHRGYRSRKRVKRAIRTLQEAAVALGKARVIDQTDVDEVLLPETSFQILYDVVPLMVGAPPDIDDDDLSSRQPAVQPVQRAIAQDVVAPAAASPAPRTAAPPAAAKPAARGGERGKQAT